MSRQRAVSNTFVTEPVNRRSASGVIRVLCVDDHALLVEGLKAQFAIEGTLEVVGRLATAARLLEEVERLRPDVVLLDIEMPGPDAFEAADRLVREHPELRVIVLSAHIRDAFISASFASGISAYFAKSDEQDDIVRGIHKVIEDGSGAFVLGPKVLERCRPVDVERSGRQGRNHPSAMRLGGPMTLLESLTSREVEILRLIGNGLSRVQIAEQLCRSVKTIDGHQDRMMKKLGIPARADPMRFAIREGLAQA
ncbi:MAG: response regulator transcription factor [Phycisphaerae bacterium]|nr:response regulator transcription factor [Phycisphaerae bacterium]